MYVLELAALEPTVEQGTIVLFVLALLDSPEIHSSGATHFHHHLLSVRIYIIK